MPLPDHDDQTDHDNTTLDLFDSSDTQLPPLELSDVADLVDELTPFLVVAGLAVLGIT